jgi:hypothetical protein
MEEYLYEQQLKLVKERKINNDWKNNGKRRKVR